MVSKKNYVPFSPFDYIPSKKFSLSCYAKPLLGDITKQKRRVLNNQILIFFSSELVPFYYNKIVLKIMRQINLKEMYDVGVHLGSSIKKLNPKMKPYIMCTHDGITIIDILKTYTKLFRITLFLKRVIATEGSRILFVGTQKSIAPVIAEIAIKSSSDYITERWKGGFLTNFKTIREQRNQLENSINNSLVSSKTEFSHASENEGLNKNRTLNGIHLKNSVKNSLIDNQSTLEREKSLIQKNSLETATFRSNELTGLPDLVIIVGQEKELKAIKECQKLNIPTLTILDTDGDPENTSLFIPANDDSLMSVEYILRHLAQAILVGRLLYDKNQPIKSINKKTH